MTDNTIFAPLSAYPEHFKKIIMIASVTPMMVYLESYQNPGVASSDNMDGLAKLAVANVVDDPTIACVIASHWILTAYETVDMSDAKSSVPWPDIDADTAKSAMPEFSHIFDMAQELFDTVLEVQDIRLFCAVQKRYTCLSRSERELFMLTMLLSAANTIHATVELVGSENLARIVSARSALEDVETLGDMFK